MENRVSGVETAGRGKLLIELEESYSCTQLCIYLLYSHVYSHVYSYVYSYVCIYVHSTVMYVFMYTAQLFMYLAMYFRFSSYSSFAQLASKTLSTMPSNIDLWSTT